MDIDDGVLFHIHVSQSVIIPICILHMINSSKNGRCPCIEDLYCAASVLVFPVNGNGAAIQR